MEVDYGVTYEFDTLELSCADGIPQKTDIVLFSDTKAYVEDIELPGIVSSG